VSAPGPSASAAGTAPFPDDKLLRLVRVVAAQTPSVVLERQGGVRLLSDEQGPYLRCLVHVANGCDCEGSCEEFLSRLEQVVRQIPGLRLSRLEVSVLGRFTPTPRLRS
jgi:hypothetical protein